MIAHPLSDRSVLLVAGCAYLPLVFLGYGADGDSYSVVAVARGLIEHGSYQPSRAPGFPTHELATALALPLGGSIATNLASLALSLIGLWALLRICALVEVPHRDLVALFVASNPFYWINSASTIDYVWALGLSLAGLYAVMCDRPWLSGALFGLAAGARITSLVVPIAAVFASLSSRQPQALQRAGRVPAVLVTFAAVACALYALPFAASGYSLAFVRPPNGRLLAYYMPEWGWQARTGRWIYKNVYLFGIPAAAALFAWMVLATRRRHFRDAPSMIVLCVLAIAGTEAAFWIAPLEPAYLLPILPFIAILIALADSPDARPWLWAIVALQLLYAVVSLSVLTPDVVHAATTAHVRPSLQHGIVVEDVVNRIRGVLR